MPFPCQPASARATASAAAHSVGINASARLRTRSPALRPAATVPIGRLPAEAARPSGRSPNSAAQQDRPAKAEASDHGLGEFELGLPVPAKRVTNMSLDARPVTVIAHGSPTT